MLMAVNDSLLELYKCTTDLHLPMEFTGIYGPKTMYEIVQLVFALRDMVIAMDQESFHRIIRKGGRDAESVETDGTTTQEAIVRWW